MLGLSFVPGLSVHGEDELGDRGLQELAEVFCAALCSLFNGDCEALEAACDLSGRHPVVLWHGRAGLKGIHVEMMSSC